MNFLETFGIILLLQIVFFAFAAYFKTDKVTDLSYGLTFIVVALFGLFSSLSVALLAGLVIMWGVRLSAYLFVRILRMKTDKRFDGIREHFWKFARFWLLQAVSIFIILLPFIVAMNNSFDFSLVHWFVVGASMWLLGFVIESAADYQKYVFKNQFPKRFVSIGLWKYARHPNYFGEMLCWWGIFLYVVPFLSGFTWIAIMSPVYITGLLFFGSGIPLLEKQHDKKYGKDSSYKKWKKNTRLLVPLPKYPKS